MIHHPNSIKSLQERWRVQPDAACAAALARASLRQNLVSDARRWAIQAVRLDPHSLPIPTLRQCEVPLIALPAPVPAANPEDHQQLSVLCAVDDATQSALSLYEVPCLAEFAPQVCDDGSIVALIDPQGPKPRGKRTSKPFSLYAFDPTRHANPSDQSALYPLPSKFVAVCAAKTREHLFVAGHNTSAAFGWYHHGASSPAWQWQDITKSFDDFVIDGDRLIAVDNIIMPKYFFIYDISEAKPRNTRKITISAHTSYERITNCAHSKRLMALLSAGMNHGTTSQFISIYDLATLRERWCIYRSRFNARQLLWKQIAFLGSRLLIAAGTEGVLTLDLQHPSVVEALAAPAPEPESDADESDLDDWSATVNCEDPNALIKLQPVPLPLPDDASVVRVVTHPDAQTAFAIYTLGKHLHALPFSPAA